MKLKKALASILALVLLVSGMSITAFADSKAKITEVTENFTIHVGDTVADVKKAIQLPAGCSEFGLEIACIDTEKTLQDTDTLKAYALYSINIKFTADNTHRFPNPQTELSDLTLSVNGVTLTADTTEKRYYGQTTMKIGGNIGTQIVENASIHTADPDNESEECTDDDYVVLEYFNYFSLTNYEKMESTDTAIELYDESMGYEDASTSAYNARMYGFVDENAATYVFAKSGDNFSTFTVAYDEGEGDYVTGEAETKTLAELQTLAGTSTVYIFGAPASAPSPYTYLDLDTTTTDILDSKDITQTYTFTESGDTKYTDASKVKVEWTVTNIGATYTGTKTWDPDAMKWVEAKAVTADDHTAEFKLTNYSSVKVNASVTFKAADALAATLKSATFKNNDADVTGKTVTLDTPVTKDQETYADSDFTANAETVTATLVFDKDEFAKLSATTAETTYGTYTVKLSAVAATTLTLTQITASITAKGTYTVTENNLVLSGSTWADVIEANKNNTVTIKGGDGIDETNGVYHLANLTKKLGGDEDDAPTIEYIALCDAEGNEAFVLLNCDSDYTDYAEWYLANPKEYISITDTLIESCYFCVML